MGAALESARPERRERNVMDLLVRTIRDRSRTRVGPRESIPHWGMRARAALGLLAAIAAAWPIFLIVLAVGAAGIPSLAPLLGGATYAMVVFHVLSAFVFGAFVVQNPRIECLRTIWLFGLVLTPPLTIPAYWWAHVWNAPYIGDREEDDLDTGSRETPRRLVDTLAIANRTRARVDR
jgi:hypothetical protein